jgi:uncharacterized YccA/Bax inhibitor family protein
VCGVEPHRRQGMSDTGAGLALALALALVAQHVARHDGTVVFATTLAGALGAFVTPALPVACG